MTPTNNTAGDSAITARQAFVVSYQMSEVFGKKEHNARTDGADDQEGKKRHPEDPADLSEAAPRLGLRYHPRHRHRKPRGGNDKQHAVDVIGVVKITHSVALYQVCKRYGKQRADDLHDSRGYGEYERTVQKALF